MLDLVRHVHHSCAVDVRLEPLVECGSCGTWASPPRVTRARPGARTRARTRRRAHGGCRTSCTCRTTLAGRALAACGMTRAFRTRRTDTRARSFPSSPLQEERER